MMENWGLMQNQPLLKTIYKKPPVIAYKKSLLEQTGVSRLQNHSEVFV